MLLYLVFSIFCYVNAFKITTSQSELSSLFKSDCLGCKWFIPNNKGFYDYGRCKMFKNKYDCDGNQLIIYEFAKHCRNTENMCGKNAILYEPYNELSNDVNKDMIISHLLDEYDEIKNKVYGEVNETDELNEIENDLMNIIQRLMNYYSNQE